MQASTRLTLLVSFLALGCSSDPDGGLGEFDLYDSTDASGKADVIGGRQVYPIVTEDPLLVGDDLVGSIEVTNVDEMIMTVEGPLVRFEPQAESLQITVEATGEMSESTSLRFILAYRTDPMSNTFYPVVVEGMGDFERPDDVDMEGTGNATTVQITYFQSISVLSEENTVTVSSDDSSGQTTATLDFDAATAEFAAFVIPVDSGWRPLDSAFEFKLTASCGGGPCATPVEPPAPPDIFAGARDVDLAEVTVTGDAPEQYSRPSVMGGFNLGGTEFWQRWPDGHSPTFSYSAGTEQGRRCMQASAIRFEAIMSDPPPAMAELLANSNWRGSFFNWNDDYTEATSGDARGARLWAWRTHLIKFISQTGRDGTCYLPTRQMMEDVAADCLATATRDDGEIQGCSAR